MKLLPQGSALSAPKKPYNIWVRIALADRDASCIVPFEQLISGTIYSYSIERVVPEEYDLPSITP
jgi:hypothetical protein